MKETVIFLTKKEIEFLLQWHDKGYTNLEAELPLYHKLKEALEFFDK